MDASSKHSSSAATASICFSHIQELWACLAWPDPAQAQTLGTQLSQVGTTHQEEIRVWVQKGHGPQLLSPCPPLQDLCEAALFYTELLRKKVDAQPGAAGEAVSEPVSRGGTGVGGRRPRVATTQLPAHARPSHLPSSVWSSMTWSSSERLLARHCVAWCGRRGLQDWRAHSHGPCSAARRPWTRTCSGRPEP